MMLALSIRNMAMIASRPSIPDKVVPYSAPKPVSNESNVPFSSSRLPKEVVCRRERSS